MHSFRQHPHALRVAALIVIGLVLFGCSDDEAVLDVVKGLHGAPAADAESEPAAAGQATESTEPVWCDSGRELDVIHLAFHESGDVFPAIAEIERGVDAASTIETTADEAMLAADAAILGDGLAISLEAGSAAIFQEEPYTAAATNIFDAVESRCS